MAHLFSLLAWAGVLVTSSSVALAAPTVEDFPADAVQLLKSLPNQRLELPFVLKRAAESSDSFRSAKAGFLTAPVTELQASSALAWRPYAKFSRLDDRREASNSFSPNHTEGTSVAVGLATAFQSGTLVQAEVSHSNNLIAFPTFGRFDYFDTQSTLSITQKLWADSFGQATRAQQRSAKKFSEAEGLQAQVGMEEWVLGLVRLYYGAWLSQAQARAAKEGFDRKVRFQSLVGLQAQRGTAEKPDVLQVEGAVTAAKNQLEGAELRLQDTWRDLVLSLKFNPEWTRIPATRIPLALDEPQVEAMKLCGSESKLNAAPESLELQRARSQAQAALDSQKRAEALARPNLELQGQVFTNGVASTANASFSDFGSRVGKGYAVGVTLSLPIGFTAEKADVLASTANWIRADAGQSIAQDQNVSRWTAVCLDLHRLKRAQESTHRTASSFRDRARLEEERFRLGRSSTFQVIQAGDDATQAELILDGTAVELRQVAWQVLRQAGRVREEMLP